MTKYISNEGVSEVGLGYSDGHLSKELQFIESTKLRKS